MASETNGVSTSVVYRGVARDSVASRNITVIIEDLISMIIKCGNNDK